MIFFITSLRDATVAHVSVIYAAVPFVAAALAGLIKRETYSNRNFSQLHRLCQGSPDARFRTRRVTLR